MSYGRWGPWYSWLGLPSRPLLQPVSTGCTRQAALVSDESALEACLRRCAIQIDDLYLYLFMLWMGFGPFCLFSGCSAEHGVVLTGFRCILESPWKQGWSLKVLEFEFLGPWKTWNLFREKLRKLEKINQIIKIGHMCTTVYNLISHFKKYLLAMFASYSEVLTATIQYLVNPDVNILVFENWCRQFLKIFEKYLNLISRPQWEPCCQCKLSTSSCVCF